MKNREKRKTVRPVRYREDAIPEFDRCSIIPSRVHKIVPFNRNLPAASLHSLLEARPKDHQLSSRWKDGVCPYTVPEYKDSLPQLPPGFENDDYPLGPVSAHQFKNTTVNHPETAPDDWFVHGNLVHRSQSLLADSRLVPNNATLGIEDNFTDYQTFTGYQTPFDSGLYLKNGRWETNNETPDFGRDTNLIDWGSDDDDTKEKVDLFTTKDVASWDALSDGAKLVLVAVVMDVENIKFQQVCATLRLTRLQSTKFIILRLEESQRLIDEKTHIRLCVERCVGNDSSSGDVLVRANENEWNEIGLCCDIRTPATAMISQKQIDAAKRFLIRLNPPVHNPEILKQLDAHVGCDYQPLDWNRGYPQNNPGYHDDVDENSKQAPNSNLAMVVYSGGDELNAIPTTHEAQDVVDSDPDFVERPMLKRKPSREASGGAARGKPLAKTTTSRAINKKERVKNPVARGQSKLRTISNARNLGKCSNTSPSRGKQPAAIPDGVPIPNRVLHSKKRKPRMGITGLHMPGKTPPLYSLRGTQSKDGFNPPDRYKKQRRPFDVGFEAGKGKSVRAVKHTLPFPSPTVYKDMTLAEKEAHRERIQQVLAHVTPTKDGYLLKSNDSQQATPVQQKLYKEMNSEEKEAHVKRLERALSMFTPPGVSKDGHPWGIMTSPDVERLICGHVDNSNNEQPSGFITSTGIQKAVSGAQINSGEQSWGVVTSLEAQKNIYDRFARGQQLSGGLNIPKVDKLFHQHIAGNSNERPRGVSSPSGGYKSIYGAAPSPSVDNMSVSALGFTRGPGKEQSMYGIPTGLYIPKNPYIGLVPPPASNPNALSSFGGPLANDLLLRAAIKSEQAASSQYSPLRRNMMAQYSPSLTGKTVPGIGYGRPQRKQDMLLSTGGMRVGFSDLSHHRTLDQIALDNSNTFTNPSMFHNHPAPKNSSIAAVEGIADTVADDKSAPSARKKSLKLAAPLGKIAVWKPGVRHGSGSHVFLNVNERGQPIAPRGMTAAWRPAEPGCIGIYVLLTVPNGKTAVWRPGAKSGEGRHVFLDLDSDNRPVAPPGMKAKYSPGATGGGGVYVLRELDRDGNVIPGPASLYSKKRKVTDQPTTAVEKSSLASAHLESQNVAGKQQAATAKAKKTKTVTFVLPDAEEDDDIPEPVPQKKKRASGRHKTKAEKAAIAAAAAVEANVSELATQTNLANSMHDAASGKKKKTGRRNQRNPSKD